MKFSSHVSLHSILNPLFFSETFIVSFSNFSNWLISLQKPCSRYCLLFKASRHGIARLEICENKDDKNPKIFTLENCVKITQEPPPSNLIQIVKRNGQLTLNTNSDEELKDWVTALQMVAFCDISGLHAAHGAIEEDNDLYCSSFVSITPGWRRNKQGFGI